MLNQQTIDIIKSTVPVLEQHGETITKTFYNNLFTDHPSLFNIFNRTNQVKGRQQGALANTVYAAAVHIENLEAIVPHVVRIAHKHRSLGILPEHYTIVGEYLLAAIKEVLQDAATDEIIQAWADAYGVIANIFISVEEDLYVAAEQNNGWRFFKPFVVTAINEAAENVKTFTLQRADGEALPPAQAGQYISIRAHVTGETYLMNRQYTLTNATETAYEISVKREVNAPNGIVSNFLHDAQVGASFDVSTPAGTFVYENTNAPTVFIAGGIGVTPLYAMLKQVQANEVTFIQCATNERTLAFNEAISHKITTLNGRYERILSENGERISQQTIDCLPKDAQIYICGPTSFMETVIGFCKESGIANENIHFEFFGPALSM